MGHVNEIGLGKLVRGDIGDRNQGCGPPLVFHLAHVTGDVDDGTVGLFMPAEMLGIYFRCRTDGSPGRLAGIAGAQILDAHRKKLLLTVSVMLDRRTVDREKAQGLKIVEPHWHRVVDEQQPE
jgi:hypothetical protein